MVIRQEWAWIGLAAVLFAGCDGGNGSSVGTATVSGVVTLDSKPLEGALVTFRAKQTQGTAVTDASGKYSLEAPVGENGVAISKVTGGQKFDAPPDPAKVGPAPGVEEPTVEELVPAKYNTDSTLKFDVPAGGGSEANFNLKSK